MRLSNDVQNSLLSGFEHQLSNNCRLICDGISCDGMTYEIQQKGSNGIWFHVGFLLVAADANGDLSLNDFSNNIADISTVANSDLFGVVTRAADTMALRHVANTHPVTAIKDYTLYDVTLMLERNGLLDNNLLSTKYIGYKNHTHMFAVAYNDRIEGNYGVTFVYMYLDKDGKLGAEFDAQPYDEYSQAQDAVDALDDVQMGVLTVSNVIPVSAFN